MKDDHEVLLCYSHRDSAELCAHLCEWLRDHDVQVFCSSVNNSKCAFETRQRDYIRHRRILLFVASPESICSIQNPVSWISRELSRAEDTRLKVILLRLPGVEQADCERLHPSGTVVAGITPLGIATLRSLLSTIMSRPLQLDAILDQLAIIPATMSDDPVARRAAVISVLQLIGRHGDPVTDIRALWPLLRSTLTSRDPVTQSSQGFYTLPLYSRIDHGRIRELVRLHFWPESDALNPFAIHSHQPYATSWILSGTFLNSVYRVDFRPSPTGSNLFDVRWDGDKEYRLNHRASTVANTGQPVSVEFECSATFADGQSYTVPAGEFHSTRSMATALPFAATLFFFDAGKGWVERAPVVGPDCVAKSMQARKTTVSTQYFLDRLDSLLS